MSAAVGAALNKIAAALLTEPETRKKIVEIVLVILVTLIMPIVAILGVFSGDITVDTNRLHDMVVQNMTDEQVQKLQFVENTMLDIEHKMREAGYSDAKLKEAQVLYTLALSDFSGQDGFADKLVGCFAENQTDEELVATVNTAFGTTVDVKELLHVISSIRKTYIDTSDYIDPVVKNNLDLVLWVTRAAENGWGYVWGTYGAVLDEKMLENKMSQYPNEVGGKAEFIRANWLGGRTADCVGLIKGYAWYDQNTGQIEIGANGMPDMNANRMYEVATEKGTIDTIPEIPGLAVWHEGHIGVYVGDGLVVQAANTNDGVIQTRLSDNPWTHWLKIPYITYVEQEEIE